MEYAELRILHMGLALASVAGFVLRWRWMMAGSPLLSRRLTRTLPHLLDTLFLGSAAWLALTIQQYPFAHAWLTAKIFGLIGYIVLGSLAIKRASTRRGRIASFAGALLVFAWVVSVARTKSAWGFLAPPG